MESVKLSSTNLYQSALSALTRIKEQSGLSPDVQAIARFLLYAAEVPRPSPLFPWQPTNSELDQATAQALTQAWQDFLSGASDDD